MLPNLKIALPIRPAADNAPMITISNVWMEVDCFSVEESAAASATAATAGGGAAAVAEFDRTFAAGVSVVDAGLADELTPDDSGQRETMAESCVFAFGAFALGLFSTLAAFAAGAGVRCPAVTLVSCSMRVCGKGSSARASATDRCGAVFFCGETGFSGDDESCGAARETFSSSSLRYQQ